MKNTIYRVSGMVFHPRGWEDSWTDCLGYDYFRSYEKAKEYADIISSNSGYGYNCYIEAIPASIVEVSLDDPWIKEDLGYKGFAD